MALKVGDKIPGMTLGYMSDEGPKQISTDELFGGKKVVVFAVPGAFTPLCSGQHLPGYVQNADAFKAKGVDEIVCLSVNDPFVMGAWSDAQGAKGKVMLVADGNAEFTKAMGLDADMSGFGLGTRSQRYAMLVEDGVIKALHVEEGRNFEVSSAQAMLEAV